MSFTLEDTAFDFASAFGNMRGLSGFGFSSTFGNKQPPPGHGSPQGGQQRRKLFEMN